MLLSYLVAVGDIHFLNLFYVSICREVWVSFVMFMKRLKSFIKYLQLVSNLENRFEDASEQEIMDAGDCLVCREGMDKGKKLACGHVFHCDCLRMWLQHQQACPLCRAEIVVETTTSTNSRTRQAHMDPHANRAHQSDPVLTQADADAIRIAQLNAPRAASTNEENENFTADDISSFSDDAVQLETQEQTAVEAIESKEYTPVNMTDEQPDISTENISVVDGSIFPDTSMAVAVDEAEGGVDEMEKKSPARLSREEIRARWAAKSFLSESNTPSVDATRTATTSISTNKESPTVDKGVSEVEENTGVAVDKTVNKIQRTPADTVVEVTSETVDVTHFANSISTTPNSVVSDTSTGAASTDFTADTRMETKWDFPGFYLFSPAVHQSDGTLFLIKDKPSHELTSAVVRSLPMVSTSCSLRVPLCMVSSAAYYIVCICFYY